MKLLLCTLFNVPKLEVACHLLLKSLVLQSCLNCPVLVLLSLADISGCSWSWWLQPALPVNWWRQL